MTDEPASTPAQRLLTEAVCAQLRTLIDDHGGREVFALGTTDESGIVTTLEPMAFGNWNAVPAPAQNARAGQVMIHNHPTGDLEPSDADISVASLYGNAGVGFYIVNSDCTSVQVVVKPFAEQRTLPIDAAAICESFLPGSVLERELPTYEHRPEQVEMLRMVTEAFNTDGIAVVEAGTGVGKSFAYLAPAISWAVLNRQRVVISTNTINLQEQLLLKDIPALRAVLGVEFKAVLLKGRGNYLSLRRLQLAASNADLFPDQRTAELAQLTDWSKRTQDGTLSDLATPPSSEAWEAVVSDKDDCLHARCPRYNECFFYKSRREAASADIIVANHHLMMADIALKAAAAGAADFTAILPPYERLIVDEAHNLEEVATAYFATETSALAIRRQLLRLRHRDGRGLIAGLQRAIFDADPGASQHPTDSVLTLLDGKVSERGALLEYRLDAAFDSLAEKAMRHFGVPRLGHQERREIRIMPDIETTDFWAEVSEELSGLQADIAGYAKALDAALSLLRDYGEEMQGKFADMRQGVTGAGRKLADHAATIQFFLKAGEAHCRWIELAGGRDRVIVRFCTAPLDIAMALREALHGRKKSIVLTSATLTVNKTFDFFGRRLGLDASGEGGEAVAARTRHLRLESPFDYGRNCLIGLPSGLPSPSSPDFEAAVEKLILDTIVLSGGRAFVLFTSYKSLNRVHEALARPLSRAGIRALKQGEMPRQRLLEAFRSGGAAALFATSSFWEGVDVQGDALQCLILVKLPFRVPTTPVLEARTEAIEQAGGDAFRDLSLPLAVIRFKQGFGRLIRSHSDRGVVLILDHRVTTMWYGKSFLGSLPPARVVKGNSGEIGEAFRAFLAERRGTTLSSWT